MWNTIQNYALQWEKLSSTDYKNRELQRLECRDDRLWSNVTVYVTITTRRHLKLRCQIWSKAWTMTSLRQWKDLHWHNNKQSHFTSAQSSQSHDTLSYILTSPILHYERRAWSWSWFLGSQPTGDLVINPVVGWRYFPSDPRLLSQPKRSVPLAGTKLYCLVTEAHRCK